jgi:hypothetical protein
MKTIKQVEAYAKKIIPMIGLDHWEIQFRMSDDECNQSANAEVQFNYKSACIFLYEAFRTADEVFQKQTIIHELLHCHTGFWRTTFNDLREHPDQSYNAISNIMNTIINAEEEPVELMARALYKVIEKK